jgi:hypothetical protein
MIVTEKPVSSPCSINMMPHSISQSHCRRALFLIKYTARRTDIVLMTPNLRKPRSKRSTPAVDVESIDDNLETVDPSSMTASPQNPIPVSTAHPSEIEAEEAAPINASNATETTPQATTVVADPSDEAEPGDVPSIIWNRMPSTDPDCLGAGFFPFDRSSGPPPSFSVHDIELRGKVTSSNILKQPNYSHTLDVMVTDRDLSRIKDFVHSSGKLRPGTESAFSWTVQPASMAIRFAHKQDLDKDFEPVWDARGRSEAELYDIEARVEISAGLILRNSVVLVEAVPEIWTRPGVDGKDPSQGCVLHLVAIGLMADCPPPPVKRDAMTDYTFTSPKKRCRRPFVKTETAA